MLGSQILVERRTCPLLKLESEILNGGRAPFLSTMSEHSLSETDKKSQSAHQPHLSLYPLIGLSAAEATLHFETKPLTTSPPIR